MWEELWWGVHRKWQELGRKASVSPLVVGLRVCQGVWSRRASERRSCFSEHVMITGEESVGGGQSGRRTEQARARGTEQRGVSRELLQAGLLSSSRFAWVPRLLET